MSCCAKPAASPLLCTEMPSNLTSQTPYCPEQSWEYLPLVYAHPQHSAPPVHGLAVGSRRRCSLSGTRTQRSPAERHLRQINPPYAELALSSLILYVLHRSPWSSWRVTPGTSIRALPAAPLPRQEARSDGPGSWLHPGKFGVPPAPHHEEQESKTQPGASQAAGCTAPAELSHPFFLLASNFPIPHEPSAKSPKLLSPSPRPQSARKDR